MKRLYMDCAIALIITILSLLSCSKPDAGYATYQDEINRFLADSEDGKELFTTVLYPDTPFYIDDTPLIFYKIDSSRRRIEIDISDNPKNIYGFNSVYDAVAAIEDKFFGNYYMIENNDTSLLYNGDAILHRYGYFLKLYSDDYDYHGWRFWGYSATKAFDSLYGSFRNNDGLTFSVEVAQSLPNSGLGNYFVLKNDIPSLPANDSLIYTSSTRDRIFAEQSDYKIGTLNTMLSGAEYMARWKIPPASTKFYHIIVLEGPLDIKVDTTFYADSIHVDTSIFKHGDLAVPYRISL